MVYIRLWEEETKRSLIGGMTRENGKTDEGDRRGTVGHGNLI